MKTVLRVICLFVIVVGVLAPAYAVPPGHTSSTDRFNYPLDSNLNGNAAWTGSAGAEIKICPQPSGGSYPEGQACVNLAAGAGSKDSFVTMNYSGDAGVIWVHALVRCGSGAGPIIWRIWLDDTAGGNLACWEGTISTCRGTIGGTPPATTQPAMWDGGFNDLCCNIDTTANTSEFFLNQTSLGVLNHGAGPGSALGKIRLERVDSPSGAGQSALFDEFIVGYRVTAEPPPFYGCSEGKGFWAYEVCRFRDFDGSPGITDGQFVVVTGASGFDGER